MESGILINTDQSLLEEIISGLRSDQKYLPSKLFYDERGSKLFDQICELDEYYLTRTELKIMGENIKSIVNLFDEHTLFIEFGSGSSLKTKLILNHLDKIAGYIPIDISEEHLMSSVSNLRNEYPAIDIYPLAADFTKPLQLPNVGEDNTKRIIYFPGSSIGNFTFDESRKFIEIVAQECGEDGGFIIGIDMVKDKHVLEKAYNDSRGVTSEFNLNLLTRLNAEFGFNFDLSNFQHLAFFNDEESRIEMHLICLADHVVNCNNKMFVFRKDETILTEYSYKYTLESFADIAGKYFELSQVWTDENNFFSIVYLIKR